MGVPSTTATGGEEAGLSLAAGAAGCCCPLPQAASTRVMAATADARGHRVLKNCVIWFLYTRKRRLALLTGARGPQFSLYRAIFPIIRAFRREEPKNVPLVRPAAARPRSPRHGCRSSAG